MSIPSHVGRYEVQRRLGAGSIGSLYLARDPHLDRLVTIQVVGDEYLDDGAYRERFLREARAVARLRHENIVIVFDIGESDDRPFMAMEYIAGETLAEVLRRKPPLPLLKRLQLVEQLCAGLAHAHAAGIIHRDIKPANLMITSDGVLKVLDFGIAGLANPGITPAAMMLRTFNYLSPEQIAGSVVDSRSDIFAAGAVLYEVIALQPAFPGSIDTGVLHRILHEGPTLIEHVAPGLDPELATIVRRALERDPDARYQNASDMRRDVARVRRRLTQVLQTDEAPPGETSVAVPASDLSAGDVDRPRPASSVRMAEHRRSQVLEHLRAGEEAFARGDAESALHYAERAAMVDPDNPDAFALIDRARHAIELRAGRALLAEVDKLLADGRFDEASRLLNDATAATRDLPGAEDLRDEVQRAIRAIGAVHERERRIEAALGRARESIERGSYDTALRTVYEVLALDPNRPEARELEHRAKFHLEAERERARADEHVRQEAERRVREEEAREREDNSRHAAEERGRRIQAAVRRAQETLARGDLETASRAVYEVHAIDPENAEAHVLRQAIEADLEARRESARAARARAENFRQAEREAASKAEEAPRREEARHARVWESERRQEGRPPAPPPDPAPALVMDENVQFTLYRPRTVQPGEWEPLLVFAHLAERRTDAPKDSPDPVAEVDRQAEALLRKGAYARQTVDSAQAVPHQGELTFLPQAAGVEFDPPFRSFRWTNPVHREEFLLRVEDLAPGAVIRGRVSVYLGSIILAEMPLTLTVGRGRPRRLDDTEAQSARPYRKIFASYSHLDRAVVEEFAAYAKAMGDRYQLDVINLRSGERWMPALEGHIRDADVFQLFWSWHALESPYVRHEWEYALQLGRPSFVRPVYWDEPLPRRGELPPRALLDLHFEPIRPPSAAKTVPPAARPRPATPAPSSVGEPRAPRLRTYAAAVAALLVIMVSVPTLRYFLATPAQQSPSAIGPPLAPAPPFSLAVLVRGPDGRSRAGVTVELFDSARGRVVRTSRTDDAGRAVFEGVAPAAYQVRASSDGANRQPRDVIVTREPKVVELTTVP